MAEVVVIALARRAMLIEVFKDLAFEADHRLPYAPVGNKYRGLMVSR